MVEHIEVWNYHVAIESGQVDYMSQISCLLGDQEQPAVVSQGRHFGDPLYGSLHQQGIDGLLEVLPAVSGSEAAALMGELRPLLECNAHPVLHDAGGPAVAQQTPPVQGRVPPGTRQHCLVVVDEEALPDFLRMSV